MEVELLISFIGASILLTLMPGPDIIFVLTESISKGRRTGIAISLGLCSGILVHTLAAVTGLSIIIQKSAIVFSIVKYLGAGYLLYLALMAIKEKQPVMGVDPKKSGSEKKFWQLMRKGFFMNVLNPKVSLFFIAFLPQFVSSKGLGASCQMLILGLIFMCQGIGIFVLIAVLSSRLTNFFNSSKFWKITKWSKVGILAGLGLSLAFAKK